jgi:hypothetical protein
MKILTRQQNTDNLFAHKTGVKNTATYLQPSLFAILGVVCSAGFSVAANTSGPETLNLAKQPGAAVTKNALPIVRWKRA